MANRGIIMNLNCAERTKRIFYLSKNVKKSKMRLLNFYLGYSRNTHFSTIPDVEKINMTLVDFALMITMANLLLNSQR